MPEAEVLSILPETAASLKTLAAMSHETIADSLRKYQEIQAVRLKHLQFQLTPKQLEVVEKALRHVKQQSNRVKADNPNERSNALYQLCKDYLEENRV